jgi:formate C-acetyltransferase
MLDYKKYEGQTRGELIWSRLNPLRHTAKMSMARAQLITDGYKEYEGYSLYRKRGLSVRKIMREIPIFIDDDQLLVGDFSATQMSPEWYPDLAASWVEDYIDKYGWKGSGTFYEFTGPEQAEQARAIAQYWHNIGGKEMWIKYMGPEQEEFEAKIGEAGGYLTNTVSEMYAEKAWNVPDCARMITTGARGFIEEIDNKLANLTVLTDEDYRAHEFYLALRYELEGVIDYAHRYAALAREKAAVERDPQRKVELEEIARVCDRVPEYPAETFQEALQSFFFAVLMVYWDTRTYGMGMGRMDQFLYPTFKKDIERGYIDEKYAQDLLECFRCKIMEKRQFWPDVMVPSVSAESHFHNVVLGGVDPKTGKDATNRLSYLFLDAATKVRTPHPTLSVRWHANIDEKFMDRALEVVAMGMGFPAFFGDDTTIQYLLERGYTLEEARNYAIGGCVLHQVPGKQSSVWPIVQNYGKMLEMTLNNGFNWYSQEQIGPKTGNFLEMKTYDEFIEAYRKQCEYWAQIAANSNRQCRIEHLESFPDIAMSCFVDDCIDRGKVCSLGGAAHNDNTQYIVPVGVQDLGNNLYVLKNQIFVDNPICSKETLLDAIHKNWEGYEDLQAKMIAMPKFGNDNPEVDELVNWGYKFIEDIWFKIPSAYGSHFEVAPHSIGFHAGTGAKCSALPDGRVAWTAMSDGAVSPRQGTDTNGPAAVMCSAGCVDQVDLFGVLFNMRFTPQSLADKSGRDKLKALIETYFHDMGGKHVQFNVMSKKQMIEAKEHPLEHQDLIVRVAGYSAYWADLSTTIQDELIARSELTI